MTDSNILSSIIAKKKGASYLQVVFADIVKYSKRKSTIQRALIDAFTEVVKKALGRVSQQYVDYAQANQLNFATDIVRIPTGDGLALVFPFEGLQQIHLDFACFFLEEISDFNRQSECVKFDQHDWCNCHTNFRVRVGISEGKGIIYRDLNDDYNVAGNVINIADRIMGLADPMQIIVSEDAYNNVIDMTTDTSLEDSFRGFKGIEVKHGLKLNLYQFCADKEYLSKEEPKDLTMKLKMNRVAKTLGMPVLDDLPEEAQIQMKEQIVAVMEAMAVVFREAQNTKKTQDVTQ